MRQKETMLNTLLKENKVTMSKLSDDEIGNDHVSANIETPLRDDAFEMSDTKKIEKIEFHFKEIMHTLGLDLTDDSLKGTPNRVAKMYIQEIFSGLNPDNKPKIALFENKYQYDQMLVEKDISFYSNCEHHFVPIFGKAHIAYISSGTVIGLSKLNRIVQYFAKRPQVQERLTEQVFHALEYILGTDNIAVVIDAKHYCVAARGVEDTGSSTVTSKLGGAFKNDPTTRAEFMSIVNK